MTDTFTHNGRTAWHTEERCDCGGMIATDGLALWCASCKKDKARKVPCAVFSRVVGYYSPTNGWNKGKVEEFKDRKTYNVPPKEALDKPGPSVI